MSAMITAAAVALALLALGVWVEMRARPDAPR